MGSKIKIVVVFMLMLININIFASDSIPEVKITSIEFLNIVKNFIDIESKCTYFNDKLVVNIRTQKINHSYFIQIGMIDSIYNNENIIGCFSINDHMCIFEGCVIRDLFEIMPNKIPFTFQRIVLDVLVDEDDSFNQISYKYSDVFELLEIVNNCKK